MRRRSPLGLSSLLTVSCVVAAMVACGSNDDGSTFGDGAKDGGGGALDGGSGLGDGDGSIKLSGDGATGESVQKLVFSPAAATVQVDGTSDEERHLHPDRHLRRRQRARR